MYTNFPVVGPYDVQRTVSFNAEDTVNWYVIKDDRGKKPEALAATPGLKFEYDLEGTSGAVRRIIKFPGDTSEKLYNIAGDTVYNESTAIGTINTIAGFVSFAINNVGQILIVDGTNGYILDTSADTVTEITDPDFPANPVSCAFLEGFFIVVQGGSINFFISAPNDGFNWDFKDFARVNSYGGNLVGVGVVNKRMLLLKNTTAEVWYLSGDLDFPFKRDNNLVFNDGCLSAATIHQEDGALFWLSNDDSGVGSVMVSDGASIKRVSWDSIDLKIRSFTDPSDVQCYIYKDDGHLFYVMSWTTDDWTFVYDGTTDFWHRMEMLPHKYNPDNPLASKVRHVSSCHAFFNGKHYVGSFRENVVYTMSLDYGDNAGEIIVRDRVFRHLASDTYKNNQIDLLEIQFQSGIGQATGPISDVSPMAYLSTSNNGGLSFRNERAAPFGKIGQYNTRTYWRLLGIHRDFVARVRIFTDIPKIFMLGGAMQYEELDF